MRERWSKRERMISAKGIDKNKWRTCETKRGEWVFFSFLFVRYLMKTNGCDAVIHHRNEDKRGYTLLLSDSIRFCLVLLAAATVAADWCYRIAFKWHIISRSLQWYCIYWGLKQQVWIDSMAFFLLSFPSILHTSSSSSSNHFHRNFIAI